MRMLRRPSSCILTSLSAALGRQFSAVAAVEPVAVNDEKNEKKSGGGSERDTLGKRLLSLVYTKRSAVICIRKWKEEGHAVRKYELNRIVRELRKLRRYKHALEICEWMKLQEDFKLQPGDYAIHLDLINKIRGLPSAEKFFLDLPEQMRGHHACTSLLHAYVQTNESAKAEALMEKMLESGFLKGPLPFNHMLSLYISNRQFEKLPPLYELLKKNSSPDLVTYNLLLTSWNTQNNVEEAEKTYLDLRKAKIDPDWVTFSIMTNLYVKADLLEEAATTLKKMENCVSKKDRAAYSSLISLLSNMSDKDGVDRVWKKLKSLFRKLSDSEYTCMISSLVKLREVDKAESVYTEWASVSGTKDSRVANILLAAYINKNQMDLAEKFYNRMVEHGIKQSYTTWELLTWGHLKEKQTDKIIECFTKAIESVKKWQPDEKLILEVLKGVEDEGHIEGAEQLLTVFRNAGHVTTEIYNSLLRTYAKAGKMPLIVAERMKKDNVQLDEETSKLIKITSKLCVTDVCSSLSGVRLEDSQ